MNAPTKQLKADEDVLFDMLEESYRLEEHFDVTTCIGDVMFEDLQILEFEEKVMDYYGLEDELNLNHMHTCRTIAQLINIRLNEQNQI